MCWWDVSERAGAGAKLTQKQGASGFLPDSDWQHRAYRVVRFLVEMVSRGIFGLKLELEGELPPGSFVLAPIHRSNIDTLLVSCLTKRRLCYIGKETVFKVPIIGKFLVALGGIPLNRDAADRDALKKSVEVLATGEPLVVFPEGQRRFGDKVNDLHEGAAYLAIRANVPIIPVGIAGTEKIWPKGRKYPLPGKSYLIAGPALYPEQRKGTDEVEAKRTKTVSRRAVAELNSKLESELQRLYDEANLKLQN